MIKNIRYKDSYKKNGLIGLIVRISDKIDRVSNMEMDKLKNDLTIDNDESIFDNLIDIAVYCILSLMTIEERNE